LLVYFYFSRNKRTRNWNFHLVVFILFLKREIHFHYLTHIPVSNVFLLDSLIIWPSQVNVETKMSVWLWSRAASWMRCTFHSFCEDNGLEETQWPCYSCCLPDGNNNRKESNPISVARSS
jgi:hypothetical protein